MMKFTAGLAILLLSFVWGIYSYTENRDLMQIKLAGLDDAVSKRDEGRNLQERIRNVRRTSMVAGDDQKFTVERLLDIGAPRMEWRFVGQPRQYGANKALYRHTFRIAGPATYTESQELMRRLATLPGFAPYKYCYGCALAPKGTPANTKMVQVEGYLYVYDPNTFY